MVNHVLTGASAVSTSTTLVEADVDPGWRGFSFASGDSDGWTTFWRVDPRGETLALARWYGEQELACPPMWQRAATPAGVHGRWRAHARSLRIEIRGDLVDGDSLGQLDVLIDDALVLRHQVVPGEQRVEVALPDAESIVEIWLPQIGQVEIRGLEFDGSARPMARQGLRWTAYGSSITQCGGAAGPSEAWPALVARRNDWQMLPLGLGGECQLDASVRRTIERRPADLISMCLGINIWPIATYNGRTLAGQVAEFVRGVREAQPHATIAVFSPILAPEWEGEASPSGLTLDDIRALVTLGASSVEGVHVIDGRTLWTREEALPLLSDAVHPDADGYRLLADRFSAILAPLMA